jgi:hypothetical protein
VEALFVLGHHYPRWFLVAVADCWMQITDLVDLGILVAGSQDWQYS